MTDTVYRTPSSDVYHTDPKCKNIGGRTRPFDPEQLPMETLRECRRCRGTTDYAALATGHGGGISKLERILNQRESEERADAE